MRRALAILSLTNLLGCGVAEDPASLRAVDDPLSATRAIAVSPSVSATPSLSPLAWSFERYGHAETLNAVWGSGPDDVYTVGDDGVALHSKGDGVWQPVPIEVPINHTGGRWFGVWGTGPQDVHIWGYGYPWVHSDDGGSRWVVRDRLGVLGPIVGRSALDFFVGARHTRDGGRSFVTTGLPPGAVWVDGSDVFVFNAGACDPYNSDDEPMLAVHSPDEGALFDTFSIGLACPPAIALSVWGSSRDDVYFLWRGGYTHWNGSRYRSWPNFPAMMPRAIWGSGRDDIWIVGDQLAIVHMGHLGANAYALSFPSWTEDLEAVWGSGPDDVYMVGTHGVILHGHR